MKIKINIFTIVFMVFCFCVDAQLKTLQGIVIANDDVEGIHVLNKSSVKYTVTDTDGSFLILAKANDTLVISGLKYELKEIKIIPKYFENFNLKIYLTEKVNTLDEVIVGRILTGCLLYTSPSPRD